MPLPGNTRLVRLAVNLFMARFSPADIDRGARTPLRIGLAGDAGLLQQFRDVVVLDRIPADVPFPTLSQHPMPPEEPRNHWHLLEDCQIIVVLMTRDDLLGDAIYRIKEALPKQVTAIWAGVGQIEPWLRTEITDIAADLKAGTFTWIDGIDADAALPLFKAVVKALAGLELAVARKMPVFRDLVAERVIARTCRQNLLIAMASALPSTLPWIGPIVGLLGVTAEIIFLTSNQLRMVLQLASVYDQEMNVADRLKELLPVIGGAFGWRALSRELVGFIPAIGPGVKGSIAYAGTRATGEAARWFYKTGTHMDAEERRRIYNEALERGETLSDAVEELLPAMQPDETQALVEGVEPAAVQHRLDAADAPAASGGEPPSTSAATDGPPAASKPRPRIDVERNAGRRRSRKTGHDDGRTDSGSERAPE